MSGFGGASAMLAAGNGRWTGELAPGWDIAGNANGGYMMAMAARAAGEAAGRAVPVTMTGHFVAPGKTGPVEASAEVVKEGRRYSTVRADLAADRLLLTTIGTFRDPGDDDESFHRLEGAPPDLPPPEECIRIEATDTFPPPFMGKIEIRHAADHPQMGAGAEAAVSGWARLLDDEPIDEVALLMLSDAFPPAVFFASVPVGWVPTVELTVHVRRRPVPGWLRCEFRTRFISDGMLEEDGLLWDASDRLVALSRQLALLPAG